MTGFRHLLTGVALAACAAPAFAQAPGLPPAYAPLSDADQLAAQLRVVAANPTDLYALLHAARLSLKVGDTDAAAALYSRAERISPQHPQVQAGMARLLVQAGRPGAALRRFQDAERLGAGLADFGADRALAYDLVGEPARAQREYRALLARGGDDEITRRYALSLGIVGLKEPALALLEPLNRRGDRGAWRARAFVLAMTGDRRGAEQIATTMMPPGMAQGLNAFFDRLPQLAPADRAFAVNFGEVRSNPARVIDARLVPPLPALAPEPNPFPPAIRAPVQLVMVDDGRKKKRRKVAQDKPEPVRQAVARRDTVPLPPPPAPTATQLAALNSARMPASFGSNPGGRVTILPPPPEAYRGPVSRPASTPVASQPDEPDFAVAAVTTVATDRPAGSPPSTATQVATAPSAIQVAATPPALVVDMQPRVLTDRSPQRSGFTLTPGPPSTASAGTILAGPVDPSPVAVQPAAIAPAPVTVAAITPTTGAPPPPRDENGDAVLAAIVAGIKVPDAELAAALTPAAAPVGRTKLLAAIEQKAELVAADRAPPLLPSRDARGRFVDAKGKPLLDPRGRPLGEKAAAAWLLAHPAAKPASATAVAALPKQDARGRFVDGRGKPLLDTRGRPLTERAAAAWLIAQDAEPDTRLTKDARGRFVDAKGKPLLDARGRPLGAKAATARLLAQDADQDDTLPAKDARGRFVDARGKPLLDVRGRPLTARAAAAKLAEERKPAPEKGEPRRYWVQVAGGANEAMLGKAWAQVAGSAKSLKGKQGWTTPLRATNRVLTGPYKSSAEAMAAVNQLKTEGVSAFMFTSDPGQKVTRLGAN